MDQEIKTELIEELVAVLDRPESRFYYKKSLLQNLRLMFHDVMADSLDEKEIDATLEQLAEATTVVQLPILKKTWRQVYAELWTEKQLRDVLEFQRVNPWHTSLMMTSFTEAQQQAQAEMSQATMAAITPILESLDA